MMFTSFLKLDCIRSFYYCFIYIKFYWKVLCKILVECCTGFGRMTTIWYNPLYDTHIHCKLVVVCVWDEFHLQHPETYTHKKTRCLCRTLWWHIDHCSCSRNSSYLSTHSDTFRTNHTLLVLLQTVFTSFHRWRTDWKAATFRKTEVALDNVLQ